MSGMGAGCGSCATLDDAFGGGGMGGGMNNVWGNNQAASLANSVMPGSVIMTPQQTDFLSPPAINNNPAVMSGAYQAGAAQAAMQQMVRSVNPQMVASAVQAPSVNGIAAAKKVETFVNQNGQTVTVSTTTQGAAPSANTPAGTVGNKSSSVVGQNKNMQAVLLNMGLIILAALAVNEAAKYYINKSLQTAETSMPYYMVYAIIAILILVGGIFLTKQHF
jgi:cobalamin biosynthesis Mg chelatase CobN